MKWFDKLKEKFEVKPPSTIPILYGTKCPDCNSETIHIGNAYYQCPECKTVRLRWE